MKVAILADTHYGVRNDAPPFMDMTKRFLDDVFFPTCRANGVTQLIHLGDVLDRRKYVNFEVANRLWGDFMLPALRQFERFDLIVGNHDVAHKNTNELSGVLELYRGHAGETLRIHCDPCDSFLLDGSRALFLPWINPENHDISMDAIRRSQAHVCLGHLELEGFEMYRGQVMGEEGLNPRLFDKFDVVGTGHFHHKSTRGNINYLGSHGEFTWADYDDERGFHLFDTESREFEFVRNPHTMFKKIHYSDEVMYCDLSDDIESCPGKYVKVVVESRKDQVRFEQFISELERANPIDVTVVDDHLNAGAVLDSMDEVDESEDTLAIFRKALDSAEFDSSRMEAFITELYQEALTIE